MMLDFDDLESLLIFDRGIENSILIVDGEKPKYVFTEMLKNRGAVLTRLEEVYINSNVTHVCVEDNCLYIESVNPPINTWVFQKLGEMMRAIYEDYRLYY